MLLFLQSLRASLLQVFIVARDKCSTDRFLVYRIHCASIFKVQHILISFFCKPVKA